MARVSIFVDNQWFHRVEMPFIGHPTDTKQRYSLISKVVEWWDIEQSCWLNDLGDKDYCADPRARWIGQEEDEWGRPDPYFWTRLRWEWVCPECWGEDINEPPEWVQRCHDEIPPYFLFDALTRRERALTREQRKNRMDL